MKHLGKKRRKKMRIRSWLIFLLALFFVFGIASNSWAVPRMINVQGRLLTSAGERVANGTRVVFSFYNAEEIGAGIQLAGWSEEYSVVGAGEGSHSDPSRMEVSESGIFSVNLGSVVPLTERIIMVFVNQAATQDPIYLNIRVNGEDIGAFGRYRQALTPIPNAIVAENVSGGVVDNVSYVRASGAGVSISGVTSGDTMVGVRGRNTGNGDGVEGESTGGIGVVGTGNKFGVYGEGTDGAGVFGKGAAGYMGVLGLTSELSNPYRIVEAGVYGESSGNAHSVHGYRRPDSTYRYKAAVYGRNQSDDSTYDSPGVFGESDYGYGVKGLAYEADMAGVYGNGNDGYGVHGITSSRERAGVYGESRDGWGVYGYSGDKYGIYGYGAGAARSGGVVGSSISITPTPPSEVTRFGVYGEGPSGVVGKGTSSSFAGVYGYSSNGHGVKGVSDSDSSTIAGVYCENTGDGPALRIHRGKISMGYTTGERPGTDSRALGKVRIRTGSEVVTVHNEYVTPSSLIFVSIMNCTGTLPFPVGVMNVSDGQFDIYIEKDVWDTTRHIIIADIEVAYLIIN